MAMALVASVGLAGGSAACGRSTAHGSTNGPAPATGSVALAQALILGTSGPTPHDTAVTFPAGEARTILFPHASADNLLFAKFDFPPSAFAADTGRDVTVRLRARPGVYGVDVETSAALGAGATVTFHYPRYFSMPDAAHGVYGSDAAFERALAVARLGNDSMLVFLPSTRPAADNLQAPLGDAGTYFVAAPR